ncbi:DUF6421 family protein, partial [Ralstonia pickettii]|uniref:DUF6421 family protein n=1 Tax=Ralstonia pickettii TaxID=329 RepID=UPI001C7181B2
MARAAASEITKLDLPAGAAALVADQALAEQTFVMWDLIHDRTHMRGDLPFDPFMIKQRMPYFLYSLEELRCDLTAFREAVALERALSARVDDGDERADDEAHQCVRGRAETRLHDDARARRELARDRERCRQSRAFRRERRHQQLPDEHHGDPEDDRGEHGAQARGGHRFSTPFAPAEGDPCRASRTALTRSKNASSSRSSSVRSPRRSIVRISRMRPGRGDITTTRSERNTASGIEWVTNTT